MNHALIADLFDRLNENQLALGAAVEELTLWVEQHDAGEVANNVRGALQTLDRNLTAIRDGIGDLSLTGA